MSLRRIPVLFVVLALVAVPLAALLTETAENKPEKKATAVAHEDLSACKHPNGIQAIPSPSSRLVKKLKGTVFNFSKSQLTLDPFTRDGTEAGSYERFRDGLLKEKSGDIYYESVEGTYFVVLSGRIADLGKHYLYEFDSKQLSRPDIFKGVEDQGIGGPGLMPKVQLGHCYLLETVDGKTVLFRLVSLRDRAAGIQWVLDDNGKRTLAIPKGKLIQPEPEKSNIIVEKLEWDPQVSQNIKSNAEYYECTLNKLLNASADPKFNKEQTIVVIKALGEMRSTEAVDYLFRQLNSSDADIKQEALKALINVGKSASLKSVDFIRKTKDAAWRSLLGNVLVGVEGTRIAKVLLKDKMAKELELAGQNPKASNPHKKAADSLKQAIDLVEKEGKPQ